MILLTSLLINFVLMKITLYKLLMPILALGIACSPAAAAGKKLKVLFLGNSYTGTNTLPVMVADVARSAGDTLIGDWNAPGGFTLQNHASDLSSLGKIAVGDWNYVVLQEQSQRPAFPDPDVAAGVYPYARKLDSLVHAQNKCGRTVFFQTWGYRDGDLSNCAAFPPICTYEGMDSMLNLRYTIMADSYSALRSPVGVVFKEIRATLPHLNLYEMDGSHPSEIGSYAAALTFYTILFGKSPMDVTFNYTLPPPDALSIKNVVLLNVYNKLGGFGVGNFNPDADFNYALVPGTKTVNFDASVSLNAGNYNWDFGDGGKSTLEKPTHTYTTDGTYTVRLIVDDCQIKDTITKTVNVPKPGNVQESAALAQLQIFPNPAQSLLYVHSPAGVQDLTLAISGLLGEKVMNETVLSQKPLDISHLATGVYLIQLHDRKTGHSVTRKLVKQ